MSLAETSQFSYEPSLYMNNNFRGTCFIEDSRMLYADIRTGLKLINHYQHQNKQRIKNSDNIRAAVYADHVG